METQANIIDTRKQQKLINSLPKFLKSNKEALEADFGLERTKIIFKVATEVYRITSYNVCYTKLLRS